MSSHPGIVSTGSLIVDQIITVLLSTTMFTAGVMGFILDNTVPGMFGCISQALFTFTFIISLMIVLGTPMERGLNWLDQPKKLIDENEEDPGVVPKTLQDTYDLPFITPWLKR